MTPLRAAELAESDRIRATTRSYLQQVEDQLRQAEEHERQTAGPRLQELVRRLRARGEWMAKPICRVNDGRVWDSIAAAARDTHISISTFKLALFEHRPAPDKNLYTFADKQRAKQEHDRLLNEIRRLRKKVTGA